MQRAHDGLEPVARVRPASVQELPAYVVRSHVGVSSIEPSPAKDLFPSWYKKPGSTSREKIIKDKVSGKRATDCTPPLAIEEVTQGDAAGYSSDPFYDSATNSEDSDDVHKCDDMKPTTMLVVTKETDGTYTFSVSVGAGTHPISSAAFSGQINISINGQVIPNGSIAIAGPGTYEVTYTATSSGSKTVSAEVIDSVLYTTIDAADVNFQVNGSSDDD